MKPVVLITGISGQDGSYLSRKLCDTHEVHGIVRRHSSINTPRLDGILDKITLHYGDITDASAIHDIVSKLQPQFLYNLAAQSHVKVSFEVPSYTLDTIAGGTLNVLEAIRQHSPHTRMYNASSSEMYGLSPPIQDENTRFIPASPYAAAKVAAHNLVKNYRDSYGLFAANGILFNHESPHRGETFVTRKVTLGVSRIKNYLQDKLILGNLISYRDWGFAGDYVDGMIKILNHSVPDDFVLATGETHTVEEFVDLAFQHVGLNWKDYVVIDKKYYRPSEVNILQGNASKARNILGWKPQVNFLDLIKMMVDADMKLIKDNPHALVEKS